MPRLDAFLSQAQVASRKEAKALIKKGLVTVNGRVCARPEQELDGKNDIVAVNGTAVEGYRTVVLVLHKPAGYVTSTDDPRDKTVMELLPEKYRRLGVVPVGRLDKDTEGLLLFTNDGALLHRLISPRCEVEKEYYAEHEGTASTLDVQAFADGLTLKDGTVCKSAGLEILSDGKCRVRVTEGRYHQVRRMLASRGLPVTYLKRVREGSLSLGNLPLSSVRELTAEEVDSLL